MHRFAESIITEGKCPVATSGSKKLILGALHNLNATSSEERHMLYRYMRPRGDHINVAETVGGMPTKRGNCEGHAIYGK